MKLNLCLVLVALSLVAGCNQKSPTETKAACLANLRNIAGAKDLLALEKTGPLGNPIPEEWTPKESEVLALTKMKSLTCPGGGRYAINPHKVEPLCSIAAHNQP